MTVCGVNVFTQGVQVQGQCEHGGKWHNGVCVQHKKLCVLEREVGGRSSCGYHHHSQHPWMGESELIV